MSSLEGILAVLPAHLAEGVRARQIPGPEGRYSSTDDNARATPKAVASMASLDQGVAQ